jgi:hypothetical protein
LSRSSRNVAYSLGQLSRKSGKKCWTQLNFRGGWQSMGSESIGMSIYVLYAISKSVRTYCLSSKGGADTNADFGSGLNFPFPGHL